MSPSTDKLGQEKSQRYCHLNEYHVNKEDIASLSTDELDATATAIACAQNFYLFVLSCLALDWAVVVETLPKITPFFVVEDFLDAIDLLVKLIQAIVKPFAVGEGSC